MQKAAYISKSVSREHLLRYKMERLQEQLNIYWKQRSHTAWLTKGDWNTQFFHAAASERSNKIRKLTKEDGGVVKGIRLKGHITNHYTYGGGSALHFTSCH